jgi:hypothetical protein
MSTQMEPFGSRLLVELKATDQFDFITSKMNYDAIQKLKRADREETVKLFLGSSYDVLQVIKTKEPAEIAVYLAQQRVQDAAAAAAVICGIVIQPLI